LIAENLAQNNKTEQSAELELLKTLLREERQTRRLITGALLFVGGFLAGALLISLGIY
jgi:ubiquinone biosynthesis protein